jgi:hypothetical protein
MKKAATTLFSLLLVCSAVRAGVVIEMEVTDSSTGGSVATDTIYAQGEMLRIDPHEEDGSGATSMIFRDETLWIVDHGKKRCQMIDKEGMEAVSAQMDEGMKQMQAEMEKMPPEQREMMQKMMKDRMPPGMDRVAADAPPRRLETGGVEQVGEFSCTLHTLYSGEVKVWEICSASEGLPGPTAEAMPAFRAMSRWAEQLRESLQRLPFAAMAETPYDDMNEVGGFPVRVRMFENGKVVRESTLASAESRDLGDDVFAVPEGYKVKSIEDQMKRKGR